MGIVKGQPGDATGSERRGRLHYNRSTIMTTRRTMPAAWIILVVFFFLALMAATPGTAAEPEAGARSSLVVSLDGT